MVVPVRTMMTTMAILTIACFSSAAAFTIVPSSITHNHNNIHSSFYSPSLNSLLSMEHPHGHQHRHASKWTSRRKARDDDDDDDDDDEDEMDIDISNRDWRAFRAQLVMGKGSETDAD